MDFELQAATRVEKGRGASRRLRRLANKIPAVLYGGGGEPVSLEIDHNHMLHSLENEAFYSHILTLTIDGKPQKAILKDLQRHPFKPKILHADFLRVSKDQAIRVHVPLHFMGEDMAIGVKEGGGIISHLANQVEIECLPDALPEFIEVDVSQLGLDESIHLSQLATPKNTQLVELMAAEPNDTAVVSIHLPKKIEEPEPDVAAEADADAQAADATEEQAADGDAAKGDAKSDANQPKD